MTEWSGNGGLPNSEQVFGNIYIMLLPRQKQLQYPLLLLFEYLQDYCNWYLNISLKNIFYAINF